MQFFGDEELVYDVGRKFNMIANEDTFVLYITKAEFFNIFDMKNLNIFRDL